ncbi:MAG: tRNA (adenosine(37)-N6)-dimethylallyltransferase MiaA [Treponemataceae bacterium]
MKKLSYNMVVVLGPTATGKTNLGVQIADFFCQNDQCAHIISADSRQVYKGLNIGSGKDLSEYTLENPNRSINYHLIDIADLSQEYSVFNYQQDFYKVVNSLFEKNILPVVVGGTGMYLDAVLRQYELVEVPTNFELREELLGKTIEELTECLQKLKPNLHNHTDLTERHRLLRAIEIEVYSQSHEGKIKKAEKVSVPPLQALVLGNTFERKILRERITLRLKERFAQGMIDEVECLHKNGISWQRLERLGLEYRFISEYLQGKIPTYNDLFKSLNTAIKQFAKRQETWFRGMQRKGVEIHWLSDTKNRLENALTLIQAQKPE